MNVILHRVLYHGKWKVFSDLKISNLWVDTRYGQWSGGYIYEPILRISYEKDTVKVLCNYWVEILNIDNSQIIMILKHVQNFNGNKHKHQEIWGIIIVLLITESVISKTIIIPQISWCFCFLPLKLWTCFKIIFFLGIVNI